MYEDAYRWVDGGLIQMIGQWSQAHDMRSSTGEPTEGERTAFDAYRLDYVNRLRKIRTVSDIRMGDVNADFPGLVYTKISFKLCGIPISTALRQDRGGAPYEITMAASLVEMLEAWQAGTAEEETAEEERFRLDGQNESSNRR